MLHSRLEEIHKYWSMNLVSKQDAELAQAEVLKGYIAAKVLNAGAEPEPVRAMLLDLKHLEDQGTISPFLGVAMRGHVIHEFSQIWAARF